jgi:micrococcal nuclease
MAKRIRLDKKIRLAISLIVLVLLFAGRGFGWFGEEPSNNSGNKKSQGETSQTESKKSAGAAETTTTVTRFVDGDTFAVTLNGKRETVRIIGIDTPETRKPNTAVQCYGPAASAYLKNLIGEQTVRLESDPLNDNRDKYGRLLRHVYLPDGRSVAKESIRGGYGFAYTVFPFTGKAEFVAAEQQAKKEVKGLWGNCEITEQNGRKQTSVLE